MTAHDEAVKAAAEALDTYAAGYLIQRGHIDADDLRIAVAAAAPILLAAERQRIAEAIRDYEGANHRSHPDAEPCIRCDLAAAYRNAARIAEVGP